MGSTLVHSPLPGERKSGMPEGTETPAPVRTTARSASSRSSPRRRAPADGASAWAATVAAPGAAAAPSRAFRPTAPPTRSSAPERGRPLGEERGDPLARILGAEDLGEPFLLRGEALVEVRPVEDALDLANGERGLLSESSPPAERRVE